MFEIEWTLKAILMRNFPFWTPSVGDYPLQQVLSFLDNNNLEKYRKNIPENFKDEVFSNINETENMKCFKKMFTALTFLPQTGF